MGEQPLPPYGACLLGSFNLTQYVKQEGQDVEFEYIKFLHDIPVIVRMMDNIIDETTYPLHEQEREAKSKRRMGLGVTGVADVLAVLGITYGSDEAKQWVENVMCMFAQTAYKTSTALAVEKGSFPLLDRKKYVESPYIKSLGQDIVDGILEYGIRNSHLISIAPTGTISLRANNVSSGIEPVFSHSYTRKIQTFEGEKIELVEDYAVREWGIKPITADQISVEDHVGMLCAAQKYVDSAVSKTCNVGDNVSWERFKNVYMLAYEGGAKGCTTFRAAGKRFGILEASTSEDVIEENKAEDETETEDGACYIDLETGIRSCGD